MFDLKKIFKTLINNQDISFSDSKLLFESIFEQKIDLVQISSLLTLLTTKGESRDEIIGAVEVLKKRAKKITLPGKGLIDTCGTGGDNKGSFNISTATAILSSACGLKVAKHGNKSVTSKSGSSDVLNQLGVKMEINGKDQINFFKKNGICFFFAPLYHTSLKNIMNIRKSLPFKTIFNLLGPLLNPVKLDYQLLGVGDKKNLKTHADCLLKYKLKSAWVVHSSNGFDELTTTGPNFVYKIKNNKISRLLTIKPQDAGLPVCKEDDINGGTPEENAYMMKRLFEGETGPIRDNVLLNTAACLVISKKADNLRSGVKIAEYYLNNYSAKKKLEELIASSKTL